MSSDGMSGGNTVDQQVAAGLGAGEAGDGTAQLTSAEQVNASRASLHAQSPCQALPCTDYGLHSMREAQATQVHLCPAGASHAHRHA